MEVSCSRSDTLVIPMFSFHLFTRVRSDIVSKICRKIKLPREYPSESNERFRRFKILGLAMFQSMVLRQFMPKLPFAVSACLSLECASETLFDRDASVRLFLVDSVLFEQGGQLRVTISRSVGEGSAWHVRASNC
jgi:hypothetical protein